MPKPKLFLDHKGTSAMKTYPKNKVAKVNPKLHPAKSSIEDATVKQLAKSHSRDIGNPSSTTNAVKYKQLKG